MYGSLHKEIWRQPVCCKCKDHKYRYGRVMQSIQYHLTRARKLRWNVVYVRIYSTSTIALLWSHHCQQINAWKPEHASHLRASSKLMRYVVVICITGWKFSAALDAEHRSEQKKVTSSTSLSAEALQ